MSTPTVVRGNLHQRKDAFLHARAARRNDQNEGRLFRNRRAHGGDQRCAVASPSEPPMKSKLCTARMTGSPSMVPRAATSASSCAGLGAGFLQPVGIALVVAEAQRVLRHFRVGKNLVRRHRNSAAKRSFAPMRI